jgi:uncharacterized protein YggE
MIFLAMALGVMALAQTTMPRTLSVTGTAERMVAPDLAYVTLAVQTQADTAAKAVQANNTLANLVMNAIRGLNIPGLTVRTLNFSVSPIYETLPPNTPVTRPLRIVGYTVMNQVEARLPEANSEQLSNNVSRVLDAALNAGANRVDNVRFDLQNPQQALNLVMADATRNARATADAMAAAAGVTLGPLQTLSSQPYYRPEPLMAARAQVSGASVPIEAGLLTLSGTVTAVWAIRD